MDYLKNIFEYELKRKLSSKAKRSTSEISFLINTFKYFDINKIGKSSKDDFLKVIDRIGLIGFSQNDLVNLFNNYDPNNSGYIDYENFSNYLYNQTQLEPLPYNYSSTINKKKYNNINIQNTPYKKVQQIKGNNPITHDNIIYEDNNNNNKVFKRFQNNIFTSDYWQNSKTINSNNNNNILNDNKFNKYESGGFKKYFQSILTTFQQKININNGITYYTFASYLKVKEDRTKKTITYEDFLISLKESSIEIDIKLIYSFYNYLDLCNYNYVSADEILRIIRGILPEERKIKIIEAFIRIDLDKKGFTEIIFLKNIYNAQEHPEVKMGRKNENEIYNEFIYTLDCFINYKENSTQLSFEDFIEYYSGISASILNNEYFFDMIDGVWNMENVSYNLIQEFNPNYKIKTEEELNLKNDESDLNNQINISYQRNTPLNNNTYIPKNIRIQNKTLFENQNKKFNFFTGEEISEKTKKPQNYFFQNDNINNQDNQNTESITNINDINEGNEAIDKLRHYLLRLGPNSIFNLEKMFLMYDTQKLGKLDFQSLESIFLNYKLSLSSKETLSIFKKFEQNNSKKINYDDLIKIIVGTMNDERLNIVKNVFSKLDINGRGNININELKQKFNPSGHPEAYSKNNSKEEIYEEFLNNLEIYKKYSLIKNRNSSFLFTLDDFIDFYTQISFDIEDDNYFNNLITGVWNYNLENNINPNRRIQTGNQIIQNNRNFIFN